MITYNENLLGKMVIKHGDRKFKIEIRQGNCLAVFIQVRKNEEGKGYTHTLFSFFTDEQHLKRIIKNGKDPFGYEVVRFELNCRYNESLKMLRHLVKFFPIKCYYK